MFLTDTDIKNFVSLGKIVIEPFKIERLTPQGYDLSLEDFILRPKEFKIFKSIERIEVPSNLVAIPFLRTTYAFKGLILSPGIIDAGFKGHLSLALYNLSDKVIETETIDHLVAIVHLIFLQTNGNVEIPFGQRINETLN